MDKRNFAALSWFVGLAVLVTTLTAASGSANLNSAQPTAGRNVAATAPSAANAKMRATNLLARLPLGFELNQGQTDSRVKFLSRGNGYALFLTAGQAVLSLSKPAKRTAPGMQRGNKHASKPGKRESQVLRVELVGTNPQARIEGVDRLPGKVNYFVGKDPRKWRSNIPTYARVRYHGVYPGIDLVYYGTGQRQLEYDFIVARGANPDAIAMRFEGAKQVVLDASGDLHAKLADGGEVIEHAPVIYQERAGKRSLVNGRWVVKGKHAARFALAGYDRSRALYIDPGLVYSTYLGGSDFNSGNAIAVDSAGSVYVTGSTEATDFPTTSGTFQTTNNAAGNVTSNAFVTKLNAAGTALVYSTYLGGSGIVINAGDGFEFGLGDSGSGIALDRTGSAYVTGGTWSLDFPTTAGAFQTVNNGAGNNNANGFVTKLNPEGTALVYSTYLGGSGNENEYAGDGGNSIAVDSTGSAYVTGNADSSDFPTTPGAFQTTNKAIENYAPNAFVTKLNPAGTALVYSTYLGGSGATRGATLGTSPFVGDYGAGIAVDPAGFAYVTGGTFSSDFPTTPGAFQTTNNAAGILGSNGFVTKLSPAGTALVYSTYLGGSGTTSGGAGEGIADYSSGIALDAARFVYVTGGTNSSDFPTIPGAFQTINNAVANYGRNAFVTKLNVTGTALVYSTYLGGSGEEGAYLFGDEGFGIALDRTGSAYVTGETWSPDFPTTAGAFQTINKAPEYYGSNVFVTELNANGTALVYSTYLGGSAGADSGNGIAMDSTGSAYLTGYTDSTDFPTTPGAFQPTYNENGFTQGFITKLMPTPTNPSLVWQNTETGERAAWFVDGIDLVSGEVFATVPPQWQIAAVADLNGDGQPDLIWQDLTTGDRAVWFMNSFNLISSEVFATIPTQPTQWQIAGVGDFNGDGHPDLIWQNTETGERAVWFMDGSFNLISSAVFATIPTQWQIAGVGDFNGDGYPDLIWQNTETGERAVWFMNGVNVISSYVFATIPAQWQIVGVGDFNGDGHPDLLWQDTETGERAVWFMNGDNVINSEVFATIPTQWQLVN